MNTAREEPFERQNARGFSHRVARDAERSCQRDFLEWHSRAQFAFQNPLTQDGRDLIRDTDPVNLRALHENVDWERNAKSLHLAPSLFTLSSVEQFNGSV